MENETSFRKLSVSTYEYNGDLDERILKDAINLTKELNGYATKALLRNIRGIVLCEKFEREVKPLDISPVEIQYKQDKFHVMRTDQGIWVN